MRRLTAAALAVALVGGAAGCGVPSSGAFTPIENEEIPYGLGEATTTTTSTTTTLPSSTVPSLPPSTVAAEPVTVYFLAGSQLVSIELSLVRQASLSQVMAALEAGPPQGAPTAGLRTALRDDATNRVSDEGGVATVDLAPNLFDDLAPSDQRLAIAQIVLTLTRQRGIGQVRFTQGDEPVSVPLGSGEFTAPGQAVSHADYELLLSEPPPPITTVAPDAASTTAAPPAQ